MRSIHRRDAVSEKAGPDSLPLLAVDDLCTVFEEDGCVVRAVDGVSIDISRGETLGIVGESGSGKSVTSLSIMRLVPSPPGRIVSGRVRFDGRDLLTLSAREMRELRGRRIAMIFQDPMTALNPFMRIGAQLAEVTEVHLGHTRRQARDHAVAMLEAVGVPAASRRIDEYPHQFSGGMRQRVMIAMALLCRPELLIADEPTTALDVTIQAQILDLLRAQRAALGTGLILISHDLGVIAGMADRVVVMYAGRVMERAPTRALFARPANPYTRGLLRSIPAMTGEGRVALRQIPGLPPDLARLPQGCAFAPRCERAADVCGREAPPFVTVAPGHESRCHFALETYAAEGTGS